MRTVFCLAVSLVVSVFATHGAELEQLRLVPFPKEVRLQTGAFNLRQALWFDAPAEQGTVLGRMVHEELIRAGLKPTAARLGDGVAQVFRLTDGGSALALPDLPRTNALEAYVLEVRTNGVVCVARTSAGLFCGLQTFLQLIRANCQRDALPCLVIQDWPSLRWRCFQDDMTRGPSSTLETLKFESSLGAYLKLNLMTFYMESQYAFKKHPQIGPPDGSLTPEDLAALVEFVKPLHLDILGNQQSFGHFGAILKHPEFAALRENSDVLTPAREGTYQLLSDLYSEVCPLLPFPWFNVCCDETWGLGTGPARDLAAQIGVGGVYVRHIRRVHDLLQDKYHKRMMMWGDIILQHPDHLQEVPKDTIMLTWGYDARTSFEDQIVPFAKSGYEFFVCPGVNNWNRILPDFGVATTNIWHFVRDGVKHGALGMLNTDWEDDGEALNAAKWHADAWAAECAWNASATSPALFNRRVGAALFGEPGDHFGQAVELLTQAPRMPAMRGMANSRFWENDFPPKSSPASVQSAASNLLAVVRPAVQHLENCRQQARCNQHILDVILFGARRMELIGQRMLDGLQAAQLYEAAWEASCVPPESGAGILPAANSAPRPAVPATADLSPALRAASIQDQLGQVEELLRKNRAACEQTAREFARLWLSENKPYALDWTLRRYTNTIADYDHSLQRVVAARPAVQAGRPLSSPEEVGMAIPRPLSRLVRPRQLLDSPLAPEMPWAEVSATHRLGLTVSAGAGDRFDLPVEVELPLPRALISAPVRAFVLETNGPAREVLAQVDLLEGDKSRLVLVLPGLLGKGQQAKVHLYLGMPGGFGPLPSAVRTTVASAGRQWLENNQVRLLLGPEGAHLYRWEVKAAEGRDLTMPGETGWAGFSDMNPLRQTPYRLKCMGRGPAMVEFQCSEAAGQTKFIRLYGGASWVEVLLNEPTAVYWDFDDPKNFAADGPTPGTWLFSNGQTGPVGREAAGVSAQVKAPNTYWGLKSRADRLALGLITPETSALHVVAPGAGAGGVGIEGSPPAMHFVTFAGRLEEPPAQTMIRLQTTLDLKHPVEVRVWKIETH